MVKVISPGVRGVLPSIRLVVCPILLLGLGAPGPVLGQSGTAKPQTKAGAAAKAAETPAAPKAATTPAASKGEDATKAASEGVPTIAPDPIQSKKIVPVEVFKDPLVEDMLDLKKYPASSFRPATPADIGAVKEMAGNGNVPMDPTTIRKVVDYFAGQLVDHRNLTAVIDPPKDINPNSATARAVEESTGNLLEPIFAARSVKNSSFLTEYNRALMRGLQPLLSKHLISRVQAMIVLGQAGCPESLKIYLDEIKSPKQTVWVKLWALRGITNIKKNDFMTRLSAAQEIESARVVSELLNSNKELPWPVQYRALETLANLRQGFVPSSPGAAEFASTAMRLLADSHARIEVRAEAAYALGMMQISSAVPRFNFPLVAHFAGELGAAIGEQILAFGTENKPKAEHYTTLLIGPLFQAFEGQSTARDSGLLRMTTGSTRGEIQKTLEAMRPLAKAAVELMGASTGQIPARKKELAARLAALKEFLAKNAPADHKLVPRGPEYPVAGGEVAGEGGGAAVAAASKVAGAGRGR